MENCLLVRDESGEEGWLGIKDFVAVDSSDVTGKDEACKASFIAVSRKSRLTVVEST